MPGSCSPASNRLAAPKPPRRQGSSTCSVSYCTEPGRITGGASALATSSVATTYAALTHARPPHRRATFASARGSHGITKIVRISQRGRDLPLDLGGFEMPVPSGSSGTVTQIRDSYLAAQRWASDTSVRCPSTAPKLRRGEGFGGFELGLGRGPRPPHRRHLFVQRSKRSSSVPSGQGCTPRTLQLSACKSSDESLPSRDCGDTRGRHETSRLGNAGRGRAHKPN